MMVLEVVVPLFGFANSNKIIGKRDSIQIFMLSEVVGFIAGCFPGKRAVKLDSLDALRYK